METKKSFPGSQSNLYASCRIVIDNGRNRQAELATYFARYTDAFFDSLDTMASEAESLPDAMTRALDHKVLRIEMTSLADDCRRNWQLLKRYIAFAFDAAGTEVVEANWEAAGWSYYANASKQNWEDVRMLMISGQSYLTANSAVLEANENMPAAFVDTFGASYDAFDAKMFLFYAAEESAMSATQAKMDANNALYEAVIKLCDDGRAVFEGSATEREFSYTAVSELVTPSGSSTLIVTVTDAETAMPLAGAEVHVNGTERTVITDAEGRAEIGVLSAGATSGTIIRDGYADSAFDTTLTTGTTTRIEASLTAMVSNPGPEPIVTPEPVTV